jgi:hypothetical protein
LKGLIYKGFNIASTKKWKNCVESAQVTETGMSKVNKFKKVAEPITIRLGDGKLYVIHAVPVLTINILSKKYTL